MANVNVSPEGLVPELGDVWTFVSTVYKQTFGKIIYRDGSLIRIQKYDGSTTPVEFQLDPATGFFLEQLGVSEIICHEKRKDPHFSLQLGVMEGERLELYTEDGLPIDADKPHTVVRVIAKEDGDAIVLEDGTVLDFGFIGPPEGIGLITVAPAEDAEAENNSAAVVDADLEAEPVDAFPAFDESLLPAALVEEIPTEERMYSDTIQRTDMFTSLYMDVPTRKQKDPKIMARLYRITDLLLALKNSVLVRDENTAIVIGQQESYIAETVEESLAKQPTGAPIASLLPVAAVKRVIFTDDVNDALADKGDIESRSDISSLVNALQASSIYNTAEAAGNPFIAYINTLLKTVEVYKAASAGGAKITVDQDVYRTVMPPEPLTGLKHVPAARDPRSGENIPLFADRHLTSVKDHSVRLLSASRIRNPVSGTTFTVAPADSGETVGHILLDNNLSRYRSPIRSSVLLWDIQASDVSRKLQTLFGTALTEDLEDQTILVGDDGATDLAAQLETRLEPALNYINRETVSVMDALGLRNLEINNAQFAHIASIVLSGTKAWDSAFAALSKVAKEREAAEVKPAIPGIVAADSGLVSEATLGDPILKPIVEKIDSAVAGGALEKYDLVYAQDLTTVANSTLGPYYFGLAGGAGEEEYLEKTRTTYKNEVGRMERNVDTERARSTEFAAEPELIICPHVEYLEKVYGIQEDDKRLLALDKVVKIFNGGQEGNYINCGTCGNHLICKHELLLINELLHPGRGVALHKALLLEFGNGVFEGAYICKNCGQRISDLEYDTHLEFDDEGRPLMGRAVVDQGPEGGEDVVIADETDAAIPFTDAKDKAIYKLARSMFERIGLHATEEMYKRVVPAARIYLETMVPSQKAYDRERDKAQAGKKPVEYKYFIADTQVGIISALVLLEFQTSTIEVPLPLPGVVFSREGFPADGDDYKVAGMAALDYVTFGLAGLFLNSAPWNTTTWASVARDKDRIRMAKNAIMNGIYAVLAYPMGAAARPAIGTYTDKYKKQLAAWRERKREQTSGTTGIAAASLGDRLPPSYRPLNRTIEPPLVPAIGNSGAFLDQAAKGRFAEVASAVTKRSHVLAQQIINTFHVAAADSAVVVAGSLRSDSTCCYTRLNEVGKHGLGVRGLALKEAQAAELEIHTDAERLLKARDSASSAAGTHIYVPWSAPYSKTVLPAPQEEDYYKLFLKNCFVGDNMGLPHQYNPNNKCRHCGFVCPAILFYPRGAEIPLDASGKKRGEMLNALNTEYETAARTALADKVTITADAFAALENRVRERRRVTPNEPPTVVPFFDRLDQIGGTMAGSLLPGAAEEWETAVEALRDLKDEKVTEEAERRDALAVFASRYDTILTEVRGTLNASVMDKERAFVEPALEALGKITANPVGAVNARNIMGLFVVHGEQIADNYNNKDPDPSKWFPTLSYSFQQLIIQIWNRIAEITTKRLENLKTADPAVKTAIVTALHKYTSWLGPVLNVWINEFRPSSDVTEKELTLLLRWTVVSSFHALLKTASPLYVGASPGTRNSCVKFFALWILDTLVTAKQRVETYQLTAEEIQEKLNERAEMERAYFLKKFDDLDLDLRKIELIKKKLKIGDWAIDSSKQFSLDPETMERSREQLIAMGVINQFDDHITGMPGGDVEHGGEAYGFLRGAVERESMHDNLFAEVDHDATD